MKMKPHIHIQAAAMCTVFIMMCALGGCCLHRNRHGPAPLGYVPRQGKLEQPLIDYISKARPGARIGIVVALNTNVTEADKRTLFQGILATNQLDRMEQQRT